MTLGEMFKNKKVNIEGENNSYEDVMIVGQADGFLVLRDPSDGRQFATPIREITDIQEVERDDD